MPDALHMKEGGLYFLYLRDVSFRSLAPDTGPLVQQHIMVAREAQAVHSTARKQRDAQRGDQDKVPVPKDTPIVPTPSSYAPSK